MYKCLLHIGPYAITNVRMLHVVVWVSTFEKRAHWQRYSSLELFNDTGWDDVIAKHQIWRLAKKPLQLSHRLLAHIIYIYIYIYIPCINNSYSSWTRTLVDIIWKYNYIYTIWNVVYMYITVLFFHVLILFELCIPDELDKLARKTRQTFVKSQLNWYARACLFILLLQTYTSGKDMEDETICEGPSIHQMCTWHSHKHSCQAVDKLITQK